VFLAVVSAKVTNPIHERYFTTTEVIVPFEHLAIEHGLFHWGATGLSYELYAESGYDTRLLALLTGLLAFPIVLDLVALLTPRLVSVIYAPLGVAAFAVGALFVFERRFPAIQSSTDIDDPSIYPDEQGGIQDYSPGAEAVLPGLDGATGERLGDALPGVASVVESDERLIERGEGNQRRYYVVSTTAMAVGDSGVRVLTLPDVTETERQRRQLLQRERDLKEQNELDDAVIAASFSFVFRIDLEGRFTCASSSVEEFLAYTADDLRGEPISVLHPDEETTERAWEQLEQVLNGEPNEVLDFPLETKTGRTVYTDARGVPVYDVEVPPEERASSDIRGVQLMVRDATDRRQREGFISVINRVLRHNVRNEMNVVSGYAAMLSEELDGDEAKAKLIEDTADRLLEISESARLIDENRDLSPELEPIDLVPIVDRSLTQLETRYPDVSVTSSVPDEAAASTTMNPVCPSRAVANRSFER
jgi:PAS domain S-box-containing protein